MLSSLTSLQLADENGERQRVRWADGGSLPDVAVLVSEDPEKEFALTMRHAGLRDDNVVAWRKSEERHHLPSHRMVRHVQRFLCVVTLTFSMEQNEKRRNQQNWPSFSEQPAVADRMSTYVFGHEVRGETCDAGGHLVDSESDCVHGPCLLGLLGARLVVLSHRHDDMTFGAGRPRDLHEKLRIHRRRFYWSNQSAISQQLVSSRQDGPLSTIVSTRMKATEFRGKFLTQIIRAASGIVAAPPPASGQDGSPRFLGMKGRFIHPIIRSNMNQV